MCERMLRVLESKKYDTRSLRCLVITGGKVCSIAVSGYRQDEHRTREARFTLASSSPLMYLSAIVEMPHRQAE